MRTFVIMAVTACALTSAVQAQRVQTFDTQTLAAPPSSFGVTFQLYNPTSGAGFAWPTTPGVYVGGGIISMSGLGATSSGTLAVMTPQASAGFSPEGVRMLFSVPQTNVKFTVGAPEARTDIDRYAYRVRGYNASGTLVYSSDYSTGTTPVECRTRVEVVAVASNPITRIDVLCMTPNSSGTLINSEFTELFDTLEYKGDATPPAVSITAPADDSCGLPDTIEFTGYSYEPDGTYTGDSLEYATFPDGPWTPIGSFTSPFPPPGGTLYSWTTATIPSGWYYLRFTATNLDNLETVEVRRVYVDNLAPTVNLRSPTLNQVVGGSVCFDGTVADQCGVTYSLEYKPHSATAYTPFATGSSVINDPLGSWNTTSPLVPDGLYDLRVNAVDASGNIVTVDTGVTVDNTAPVASLTSPAPCDDVSGVVTIIGVANDAHMSGWVLSYSSPLTGGWVPISTGTANISGVLGTWNTSGLPSCAYTLRLLVSDRATVNCNSSHTTERLLNVNVVNPGVCDDIDFNNDSLFPDTNDIDAFLSVFSGGACL
ncbi:MAG: hypothetical protein U0637_15085 [Phycisphaerales bacterium]